MRKLFQAGDIFFFQLGAAPAFRVQIDVLRGLSQLWHGFKLMEESDEVVSFQFVFFEHSLEKREEVCILWLAPHMLFQLLVEKLLMAAGVIRNRSLAALHPFLQAEAPRGNHLQQSQPQCVEIKSKRIEFLAFGRTQFLQQRQRTKFNCSDVHLFTDFHLKISRTFIRAELFARNNGAFFGRRRKNFFPKNGIVEIAEYVNSLAIQNVFRFYVSVSKPLSLHFLENSCHLPHETIYFVFFEGLHFLSPHSHEIKKTTVIFFHEEQNRGRKRINWALLCRYSEHMRYIRRLQAHQSPIDLKMSLLERNFFDHTRKACLYMPVERNDSFAMTLQLLVFELRQIVKDKWTNLFANTKLNHQFYGGIRIMIKIQILSSEDPLLESVRAVLKVNKETFTKTLRSAEEYCYGVALQKDKIIAVCSLHVQYKFTRFLCQSYHAKLLKSTGVQSEKALWDGICERLSCYKVIGTDFSHERTKQEQVLMVYDVSASPHL